MRKTMQDFIDEGRPVDDYLDYAARRALDEAEAAYPYDPFGEFGKFMLTALGIAAVGLILLIAIAL